jgi:hypothetical protein
LRDIQHDDSHVKVKLGSRPYWPISDVIFTLQSPRWANVKLSIHLDGSGVAVQEENAAASHVADMIFLPKTHQTRAIAA